VPILPPEPDMYPEVLLQSPPADAKWWAVYTLSRREKDFMRRLRALEIAFYGPMIRKTTRSSSGRQRSSYVPLFPGYVFLCGDEEQRRDALATNCVSNTLEVGDVDALLQDLIAIRRLVESDVALSPEARLVEGMRVRVRSGPFEGVEGVVVDRRGEDTLLVAVNFLQQGVSVSMKDYEMEQID